MPPILRTLLLTTIVLLPAVILTKPALSAPINTALPTNAFISYQGLDWAWGGPCAFSGGCGDGYLTYQSTLGWRLPTTTELLALPSDFAELFRFPGANAPDLGTQPDTGTYFSGNPGGDAACASAWFSTVHTHCDWNDGAVGGWAGLDSSPFAEQLYVRSDVPSGATDLGEPLSLSLLGIGLAALTAARRRR